MNNLLEYRYDTAYSDVIGDILAALKDTKKEKIIRHHILSLCSQNDDEFLAFCERLLETYLTLYMLSVIDNKIEPIINKWTNKFYGKVVNRLGQFA